MRLSQLSQLSQPLENSLSLMVSTDHSGFEQLVAANFPRLRDRQRIMAAYPLAKNGHRPQNRDGGGRYFEHPKAVALLLMRIGIKDSNVIIAALLHDIVEDSFLLTLDGIQVMFGDVVWHIVDFVSKDKTKMTDEEYFRRLLEEGAPRDWLVKCADRLHNMSTLCSQDPFNLELREHFRVKGGKQAVETRKYILPMAERLSNTRGYKRVGRWFVKALTAWCNHREQEFNR